MGRRVKQTSKQITGTNYYEHYLSWVANSNNKTLLTRWIIMFVVSAALITTSSFFSIGGSFPRTAIALPSAFLIFIIALGATHKYHIQSGRISLREKYSARQRQKIAIALTIIVFIISLLASSHMPYTLGGTLLVASLLGILNFVRMTKEENDYENNGVIDPRDLSEKVIFNDDDTEEEEDQEILDDNFSWEEYDTIETDSGRKTMEVTKISKNVGRE